MPLKKHTVMLRIKPVILLAVALSGTAKATSPYERPDQLCAALVSEGLQTKGWAPSKAIPGEWGCMTDLVPFGKPGPNGLQNNIAFYVSGASKQRVIDVRIKINVNNPVERLQAQWRLEVATATLFKALPAVVPVQLRQALTNLHPAKFDDAVGQIEVVADSGRIESFKVVLTPRYIVQATAAQRTASVGDFERCREAVSMAVKYGVDEVQGDGRPVQEAGYRSFMLTGRGRDVFFCEVHGGSRYKIKAALGGRYPFKYIAQGSF